MSHMDRPGPPGSTGGERGAPGLGSDTEGTAQVCLFAPLVFYAHLLTMNLGTQDGSGFHQRPAPHPFRKVGRGDEAWCDQG